MNDKLHTCQLCNDTFLAWQLDSHLTQKHHSMIAYTIRVEGQPLRHACEACALTTISLYNLEQNKPYASWYEQDLPDQTQINVRQAFTNAKLFAIGCDICNNRY